MFYNKTERTDTLPKGRHYKATNHMWRRTKTLYMKKYNIIIDVNSN